MRKKDLLSQNIMLFEQLRKVELENTSLRKKNKALENEIEKLNLKLQEMNGEEAISQPLAKLEEKVTDAAVFLDDETQYGADVIGKIVLKATEYNSRLGCDSLKDSRTLINLILGKTEIAKAEILSVISDDCNLSTKKSKIDTVMNESFEYFENVMAQID